MWAVVACAFVVFVTGAAGASGSWGHGVEAVLPANAVKAGQSADLYLISCPSFGNCTAVGTYFDGSGNQEGLLLTETAGAWATGVEAVLPANAASTNGLLHLDALSCASPGNCSAVGGYTDTSRTDQGLLLTETAGKWSKGVEAVTTLGHQNVAFPSVSCPSAGNCVAVGDFFDSTGGPRALLFTETAGSWSAGIAPGLPSNAWTMKYSNLQSVSCPSVGNCSAVGNYTGSQGLTVHALMLKEVAGKWATGNEATLPAGAISNQLAALDSVSCASAGSCSAAGTYYDNNGQEVLLLRETAGSWATGVKGTLPSNAAATNRNYTYVPSISCASVGNCVAVGGYEDNSATQENPGTEEPLLLSETNGTWAAGVEAHMPADRAPLADSSLVSVSCPSAGNCDAVGDYVDNSGDLGSGVLVNETAGSWATGVKATFPSNAAAPGAPYGGTLYPVLSSVSCAGPGSCNAVGSYVDSAGYMSGVPPGNYSTAVHAQDLEDRRRRWNGDQLARGNQLRFDLFALLRERDASDADRERGSWFNLRGLVGQRLLRNTHLHGQDDGGQKRDRHLQRVISQSPKAGKHLPKGSEIALKVAK